MFFCQTMDTLLSYKPHIKRINSVFRGDERLQFIQGYSRYSTKDKMNRYNSERILGFFSYLDLDKIHLNRVVRKFKKFYLTPSTRLGLSWQKAMLLERKSMNTQWSLATV